MLKLDNHCLSRVFGVLLVLILTLNVCTCKGIAQEQDTVQSTTKFDFSKIEKFRNTKLQGQIINDYDSIFSPSQRIELTKLLYDYDIKTTRQVVVVTVDSIKPYSDIQKYATDLMNYWGVGNAETNNGLAIVLCKPCRKVAIATGYGTELVLTDDICKKVIEETIIPEFKKGDYYLGIKTGVLELIERWE
ncbi:TPM domain-containing protein [Subsaxibacter sp. CAU 1640]|uniref:TPM domain-containing protein n=1 Tax=Subsaxibacter sp. CAU 1640 TaxID=2933271 RepID=UPI00200603DB|nr:TPM domain-containing protein [Subsaxibacter sp. CAU 1640]MCK7591081.1 TPM domain-containing protein [Subsaxibacter sp. CAU 1640]